MGFFTDTSVCIGCKACEVACKQWNSVPEDGLNLLGMSFDNTGALGADTWRHVAFIEQPALRPEEEPGKRVGEEPVPSSAPVDLGMPGSAPPGANGSADGRTDFRWLMS